VSDGVDLAFVAGGAAPVPDGYARHYQRIANLLLAGRVLVWHLELARAARLLDLDRVLHGVDLRSRRRRVAAKCGCGCGPTSGGLVAEGQALDFAENLGKMPID
jgi:hypothetical protein